APGGKVQPIHFVRLDGARAGEDRSPIGAPSNDVEFLRTGHGPSWTAVDIEEGEFPVGPRGEHGLAVRRKGRAAAAVPAFRRDRPRLAALDLEGIVPSLMARLESVDEDPLSIRKERKEEVLARSQ